MQSTVELLQKYMRSFRSPPGPLNRPSKFIVNGSQFEFEVSSPLLLVPEGTTDADVPVSPQQREPRHS